MGKYVSSVKCSGSFCVGCFIARDKYRCFGESVCDHEYGIVGVRVRKFYYEV